MCMRRKERGIVLFCILLSLSGCAKVPAQDAVFEVLAPESELTVTSAKTGVSAFLKCTGYEKEDWYNITPAFIADNSDFSIFKNVTDTYTYILYDGTAYDIGECFGGFGMTSMALADLNKDGAYELYYTFSFGSGLHISSIGYFDPASKEVTILEYALNSHQNELMLTVNEAGDLCINLARIDSFRSFVDFSMKAEELVGTVVFKENAIELDEIGVQIENQRLAVSEAGLRYAWDSCEKEKF